MEEKNFVFDADLYDALENILSNHDSLSDYISDIVTLILIIHYSLLIVNYSLLLVVLRAN